MARSGVIARLPPMCLGFNSGLWPYAKFSVGYRWFSGFPPSSYKNQHFLNSNSTTIEQPHKYQLKLKSGSFLSFAISLKRKLNIVVEEFETETDAGPEYHTTNKNERVTPLSKISQILSFINFVKKRTQFRVSNTPAYE